MYRVNQAAAVPAGAVMERGPALRIPIRTRIPSSTLTAIGSTTACRLVTGGTAGVGSVVGAATAAAGRVSVAVAAVASRIKDVPNIAGSFAVRGLRRRFRAAADRHVGAYALVLERIVPSTRRTAVLAGLRPAAW